jgi:hypothetical protein
MRQPDPRLFPAPTGSALSLQSLASAFSLAINELQRWYERTVPKIIDDTVHPKITKQEVSGGFTIEPRSFNIELTSTAPFTSSGAQAIADGDFGQILLIQNRSTFNLTMVQGAKLKLNGAASYIMAPDQTLAVKWDGTNWVEWARSTN